MSVNDGGNESAKIISPPRIGLSGVLIDGYGYDNPMGGGSVVVSSNTSTTSKSNTIYFIMACIILIIGIIIFSKVYYKPTSALN